MKKSRAQTGLEYIILIGGVVILAAASYFLMKGFLSQSQEGGNRNMATASQLQAVELFNMGRQKIRLAKSQWYKTALPMRFGLNVSNTNPAANISATVSLNKTQLQQAGVDLENPASYITMYKTAPGSFSILNTILQADVLTITTQEIPANTTAKVYIYYNNTTAPYQSIQNIDYTIDSVSNGNPADIQVNSSSIKYEEADNTPPTINEPLITSNPHVGTTVEISFPILDTTETEGDEQISTVRLSLDGGNTWIDVDNLRHPAPTPNGMVFVDATTSDQSYGDAHEMVNIQIHIPDDTSYAGNYDITIQATDSYGNTQQAQKSFQVSETPTAGLNPKLTMYAYMTDSGLDGILDIGFRKWNGTEYVLEQNVYTANETGGVLGGQQTDFYSPTEGFVGWNNYEDSQNATIQYSTYDGFAWTPPEVLFESKTISSETGGLRVQYDADGNVHVIYRNGTSLNMTIYHAIYDGDSWETNILLDQEYDIYSFFADFYPQAIAMWKLGSNPGPLNYSKWDGSSWSTPQLACANSTTDNNILSNFDINQENKGMTIFRLNNGSRDRLGYCKWDGNSFETQITDVGVADDPDIDYTTILYHRPNNAVITFQRDNGSHRYITYDGSSFSAEKGIEDLPLNTLQVAGFETKLFGKSYAAIYDAGGGHMNLTLMNWDPDLGTFTGFAGAPIPHT